MAGVMNTVQLDLAQMSLRKVNHCLHHDLAKNHVQHVRILNPNGQHSIAVGLDAEVVVEICGHTGYYAAGMNKRADVTIHGNVGPGVAENIMSGIVRVKGSASACAGASGCGGLVIIEGNTSSRCGISLKGCDIVVGGSVGHVAGFMAQAGRLVICGDAGAGLGDSLYEAVIYVRGTIHGLGADARLEPMTGTDYETVAELLTRAGIERDVAPFKRVSSAKTLYHWNIGQSRAYG